MKKLVISLTVVAIILCVLLAHEMFKQSENTNTAGLDNTLLGGDFTLKSQQGDISLSDYKGKVKLLFFGYTFCPDICPGSLQRMSSLFKKLTPDELSKIQGILISLDPDRDTLQKLEDYATFFHPQIIGLTGSKEQIDKITKRFNVKYRKTEGSSPESYLLDHTGHIFVLDGEGAIRHYLPYSVPIDSSLEAIRTLIDEIDYKERPKDL